MAVPESVKALAERYGLEYWREKGRMKLFPEEFWIDACRARLPGALIPREYGGLGMNLAELCEIVIYLAGKGFSTGLYPLLTNAMSSLVFMDWGTSRQREVFLPRIAAGDVVVGLSVTEKGSGSDVFSIETEARMAGGRYVINGAKMFANNVERASHLLLLARTTPVERVSKRSLGLTLFIVSTKSSGLTYRILEKMGTDYISTYELFLENVEVSQEDVVGKVDEGWKALVRALNADRIVYAALAIGTAQFSIEQASKYASTRKVFGKLIGANQGIQFPLAESYAETSAGYLLCMDAARDFDSGGRADVKACMAKYFATKAALKAVDNALQVLGGYGYLRDWDVERVFRDIMMLKVGPITQELALAYIAEKGLSLPRSY